MKDMNYDEHDEKNNQNIFLKESDEKECSENVRINHVIHPLKLSKNPRAIGDEEWKSMLWRR